MEDYILKRKRGMKNLRLCVKEDGKAYVSAPYGVSKEKIDEFVSLRQKWIDGQRQKLIENPPIPPKNTLSERDMITILGKEYRVKVIKEDKTFLGEKELFISLKNVNGIEQAAFSFMAELLYGICEGYLKKYLTAAGYAGRQIKLSFKYLKSKWGSYNLRSNTMTFNIALIKLPEEFIEYVVVHEIVHIYVHNHSDEFYKLGESFYEGFFSTDRRLNKIRNTGIFS